MDPTNQIECAEKILKEYSLTFDINENIHHVLTDLMLYCRVNGIDFEDELARAYNHFFFEKNDFEEKI